MGAVQIVWPKTSLLSYKVRMSGGCALWLQGEELKRSLGSNPAIVTRENQSYSIGFSGVAWGLHLAFVIRAGPL